MKPIAVHLPQSLTPSRTRTVLAALAASAGLAGFAWLGDDSPPDRASGAAPAAETSVEVDRSERALRREFERFHHFR